MFHTDGAPNPADTTVEAIAGQVTAGAPTDPGLPWRTVSIVDIPVGQVVRIRGVERAEPDGVAIGSVVLQTLVPVPGDRGVLNVVLSSPHGGIAEELFAVFEAIRDTLAWSPDRPDQLSAAHASV